MDLEEFKRDGRIANKQDDILRRGGKLTADMTTLTNDLEKFTGLMFSHPETFGPHSIAVMITKFEARRSEMDGLMTRINAISLIAPEGTSPEDIATNVGNFMISTGYDDSEYSAQFDG
ncbi:MAG: hypothetical protein JKY45_10435 [Emcibacter sp.]|nr:hypothetical protein [Emcibacter sp.]